MLLSGGSLAAALPTRRTALLVALVAVALVAAALLATLGTAAAQLVRVGSSVIATGFVYTGWRAAIGRERRVRAWIAFAVAVWAVSEVARLVGLVTGIPADAAELSVVGLAVGAIGTYVAAAHGRLRRVEEVALYLDAIVIFFALLATVVVVGERWVTEPAGLAVLVHAGFFVGIVGATLLLDLTTRVPLRAVGPWELLAGLALGAAGYLALLTPAAEGAAAPALHLTVACGALLVGHGGARWTADEDRAPRYLAIAAWLRALRGNTHLYYDPLVNEYLELLAWRLASHSDIAEPRLTLVMLNSNEINAFAVPGGVMGVNAGLLLAAADEGEVAAGTAVTAVLLDDDSGPRLEPDVTRWASPRTLGHRLGDRDAGLAIEALGMANWHATHRFSPRTGNPTVAARAGWVRVDVETGAELFPRTDAAIIVGVTDGDDRLVLGSNALWESNRFSLLAGFVEPGESLEAAVVREVHEEAGLHVIDPVYVGSQPWPFPASLMLGFRARLDPAHAAALRPDGTEILDLRWFSRDELAGSLSEVLLPGRTSIARAIIEDWYGGPLDAP